MDEMITRTRVLLGAAAVLALLVVPVALAGPASNSDGPEATASGVKKQVKKLKKQVNTLKQQVAGLEREQGDSRPPRGAAGGGLTGTYPNPRLAANSVRASQLGPIVERLGALSSTTPANTGFSVSATCDPGEVAISGGVEVSNSFTTHMVESRRVGTDTWTVGMQTGANPDTALAYVYCLQV